VVKLDLNLYKMDKLQIIFIQSDANDFCPIGKTPPKVKAYCSTGH
jgi:hypothetical protein